MNKVQSRSVTVTNPNGLHVRPIMRFIDEANKYKADVKIRKGKNIVDGKQSMEMILLEATCGTQLELLVEGSDADKAIEVLACLLKGLPTFVKGEKNAEK